LGGCNLPPSSLGNALQLQEFSSVDQVLRPAGVQFQQKQVSGLCDPDDEAAEVNRGGISYGSRLPLSRCEKEVAIDFRIVHGNNNANYASYRVLRCPSMKCRLEAEANQGPYKERCFLDGHANDKVNVPGGADRASCRNCESPNQGV
jgi:hypothetical protein